MNEDNPLLKVPFSAVFKIISHGRGVFTEEQIASDINVLEARDLRDKLNEARPSMPNHHYSIAIVLPEDTNPTTGMI